MQSLWSVLLLATFAVAQSNNTVPNVYAKTQASSTSVRALVEAAESSGGYGLPPTTPTSKPGGGYGSPPTTPTSKPGGGYGGSTCAIETSWSTTTSTTTSTTKVTETCTVTSTSISTSVSTSTCTEYVTITQVRSFTNLYVIVVRKNYCCDCSPSPYNCFLSSMRRSV
jgi:hypothetical protein